MTRDSPLRAAAQYRVERRATAQQRGRTPVGSLRDHRACLDQMVDYVGHFIAQRIHDGTPQGVRMVKLHDAPAVPSAVPRRTRIPVDEYHVPAAAGQRDGGEQAARAAAHDDRSHPSPN
jgi:hypothetical protein